MSTTTPAVDVRESDARIRALAAEGRWSEITAEVDRLGDPATALAATASNAYKAFRMLGDAAKAEEWLGRALALVPTNATLQRDLGIMHLQRAQWPQAVQCFEKAVAARPETAVYRGHLATALFHCARYADAAEQFRAGLALDSSQLMWWRRLARSLVHLNEPVEAVQAYERALALQDDTPTRSARDELLRQMRSGSRAASAAYYDAVFTDSPKYAQDAQASEYLPAWQAIAELLRSSASKHVLDLGCGPGQFAEFLAAQLPAIEYTGVDFSGVAVSRARQRCPSFLFEKRELPLKQHTGLPPFDVVVCTEVLEHVDADCEILAALPAGTLVAATVPNYDAFGHLRHFADAAEVHRRYGALFGELQVRPVALSAQRTLWLLHGTRSDTPLPAKELPPLPSGAVDLGASAVDCILWSDGTRYALDFLPQFGLPFVTVADSVDRTEPHVALRHDVDWSIEQAYAMAVVEHSLGIRSSYYLLHPDGRETQRNYFGQVADGRLVIDPTLFDWAARLIDLGHEVGFHNDLITLALATRRQPGEFLEQIVEAFVRRGFALAGSVAHGARLGRELGYMNYQIFADLPHDDVALDYCDRVELFGRFREPEVVLDGHRVEKFRLRMADFGLRYEANFVAREIYLSDSSARWTLWHDADPVRIEKFAPRSLMQDALAAMLLRKNPTSGVQCLVHACHWSAVAHAQERTVTAVRRQIRRQMGLERTKSMLRRLAAFDNVVVACSDGRFHEYDHEYGAKPQLYSLTSSVTKFIDNLVHRLGPGPRNVLEVGCGQGDLLAGVVQRLQARGDAVNALGVDGSTSAIVTCAGRYPGLRWAADSLEHFLEVHDDTVRDGEGRLQRYDLVLDKTGAIFIDDIDAARAYFARIDALMLPGALYVYIASRHYYEEVLRKKNYAAWPEDWMTLAAQTWATWFDDDDTAPALRGYYKRVFRKAGSE